MAQETNENNVGLKINGFEYRYFNIKQAAGMLNVSESSVRNFIDHKWLDANKVEHVSDDILIRRGKRNLKVISNHLIDNILHALWVPAG
jgi:hypothetical protein